MFRAWIGSNAAPSIHSDRAREGESTTPISPRTGEVVTGDFRGADRIADVPANIVSLAERMLKPEKSRKGGAVAPPFLEDLRSRTAR
jgi:hypothetical protein